MADMGVVELMEELMIDFEIKRDGTLIASGEIMDRFSSVNDAADIAIRFAQDAGKLYRIFYPL